MTNVLLLNTGQDTAGGSIRTKQAFDRLAPDWNVRTMNAYSAISGGLYLQYPTDLIYGNTNEAQRWYGWADIVHMGNTLHAWEWFDNAQYKPTVVHHHGTIFRDTHESLARRAREIGAVQLCSTMDLTLYERDVTWAPTPYNLDWLKGFRQPNGGKTVRIGHAPTNRMVKSTEAVIAAVDDLRTQGYDVELDVIEGVSWQECLERKGRVDIFVDQVQLGYGCNAIEAWGMGIPVIAGVSDNVNLKGIAAAQVREAMVKQWGTLPFFEATEATIAESIAHLIDDATARAIYTTLGREHIARWHDEGKVVAQLQDIYRNAQPTRWARRHASRPKTGAERRGEMVA